MKMKEAKALEDRRYVKMAMAWQSFNHGPGVMRYASRVPWLVESVGPLSWQAIEESIVDGILCQLHPRAADLMRVVLESSAPKVSLSDYVPEIAAPTVMPDFASVGRLVADHLLQRRFRSFCFVGTQTFGPCFQGFRERTADAGFETTPMDLYVADLARQSRFAPEGETRRRREALKRRLMGIPKPVGLMCPDYRLALNLIDLCVETGLHVPEEVAVASTVEHEHEAEVGLVPVTAVVIDFAEQAYVAAELLDRMMNGEKVEVRNHLLPQKRLIVHRSTDTIAVEHLDTAFALRFIRDNLLRSDLSVTMVAHHIGASERSLHRYFQQHVGQTVSATVQELRLTKAREMLVSSNRRIEDVARACGYSDSRHLRRALERETGLTPRQFRRRNREGGDEG